jgi:hypothetical protein
MATVDMKKLSNKTLPQTITTEELMKVDYHFNYSNKELNEDWKKLKKVTKFKTGSQWKPGLKICQHFCKNFFDIETRNGKSFSSIWHDPVLMDKVRTWGLEKMSALYLSWIRRAVYMASGMHNPSFFRPHLAKQIILSTNKINGTLFDPCAGWGGRMLGTTSAGWNYIGCEPNVTTYGHLLEMVDFLDISNFVTLYNCSYEDLDLSTIGKVDVVLTSPPYFDLELYSNDNSQSYIKYSTYSSWLDNWYLKMIKENSKILTDDGLSCYNVMNGRCENIVERTIERHADLGYQLVNQIGIDSPFKNYKKNLTKQDLTYIFQK